MTNHSGHTLRPMAACAARYLATRAAAFMAFVIAGSLGCGVADSSRCADLAGATYVSEAPMECGLGPDGVVTCPWSVAFSTDGTYSWAHSDYGESGSYRCNDNVVTTLDANGQAAERGALNQVTGDLTWQGALYHRATATL